MSERISVWQAISSVLASFVGIQSQKNLDRDAPDVNMKLFIILGVAIAIILHVFLYIIAKIIATQAGVP